VNCDDVIDPLDIEPFVLALTDPALYTQSYPVCFLDRADMNGDGHVDAFDVEGFLTVLAGP
jgi:hypothetical protein